MAPLTMSTDWSSSDTTCWLPSPNRTFDTACSAPDLLDMKNRRPTTPRRDNSRNSACTMGTVFGFTHRSSHFCAFSTHTLISSIGVQAISTATARSMSTDMVPVGHTTRLEPRGSATAGAPGSTPLPGA